MTAQPIQEIGPYTKGELPQTLVITIKDADDNVIDLSGFTANFVIKPVGGQTVSGQGAGAATIPTPLSGITNYPWVLADVGTIGTFRAQMWVNDSGGNRFASDIFQYDVDAPTDQPF